MALENIETLEKDIAAEMKAKETTVRQMPVAADTTGNTAQGVVNSRRPVIITIVSVVFILIALVSGYFGYQYYKEMIAPPVIVPITNATSTLNTPETLLRQMSPEFPDAIGRYVTKVQKNNFGYTVYITNYSPVFSYMLRNEASYGASLAKSLGVAQQSKTIFVNDIAPTPVPILATTSTSSKKVPVKAATSSAKVTTVATSSKATTTVESAGSVRDESSSQQIISVEPIPFTFYDTTVSNQNIRVGKSGDATIFYAFIQEKAVVFSTSLEGIMSLKNDILR